MPEITEEILQKISGLQEANNVLTEAFEPLYTAIGRNYYEKPDGFEKEIAEAVEQLDSMKKQIHENYLETLALRGIRLCPNCGSEVEEGAIFCGECGTRMEPVEEADENSIICGRCGAKNDKHKKFCIICGQKLVDVIKPDLQEKPEEQIEQTESAAEELREEAAPEETDLLIHEITADVPEAAAAEEPAESEEGQAPEESLPEQDDFAAALKKSRIYCPCCGTELPPDALFCAECGSRVHQEITDAEFSFCPECGTKINSKSVYCPECGKKIHS